MFNNVYILIPVFNEENIIENVINELKTSFKHIVVVNDGSTDLTSDILDSLNVTQLKHSINLGQGAAISSGLKYIKKLENAKAIITFDADGQHSVDDARSFAAEILQCEEDVIFGSRFIHKKSNTPFIKRVVLTIVIFFTKIVSKVNLTDAHNGLKAFKKSCLKDIEINIDGFGFESQIIHQVSMNNIKYKELPTTITYTDYSKGKGQKILNGLIILEDIVRSRK